MMRAANSNLALVGRAKLEPEMFIRWVSRCCRARRKPQRERSGGEGSLAAKVSPFV